MQSELPGGGPPPLQGELEAIRGPAKALHLPRAEICLRQEKKHGTRQEMQLGVALESLQGRRDLIEACVQDLIFLSRDGAAREAP